MAVGDIDDEGIIGFFECPHYVIVVEVNGL